jgi:hypothetical protein
MMQINIAAATNTSRTCIIGSHSVISVNCKYLIYGIGRSRYDSVHAFKRIVTSSLGRHVHVAKLPAWCSGQNGV